MDGATGLALGLALANTDPSGPLSGTGKVAILVILLALAVMVGGIVADIFGRFDNDKAVLRCFAVGLVLLVIGIAIGVVGDVLA